MRFNEPDLNKLFIRADQFAAYIGGQKPQAPFLWDQQMVLDLKRSADDPGVFVSHCKIQHPIRGAVPFNPYEFQCGLIAHVHENRFSIVNSARQMGTTTTIMAYALWFASMHPNKTILIASNRLVAAMECLERLRFMHAHLPDHLRVKLVTDNKTSMEFENGSLIIARAAAPDTGRGMTVDLMLVDDMAYISHSKAEAFWTAIQPTLIAGRCIAWSCPSDDEGMFYQIWRGAMDRANGFEPILLPWHVHPDRDATWAAPFQNALSEAQWKREFECEFISRKIK